MSVRERKAMLRQSFRALFRDKEGSASSLRVGERVQEVFLGEYPPRPGMAVALYNAVRGEVGTDRIREAYLAAGAELYYPRVAGEGDMEFLPHGDGDGWEKGPFGIPEPLRLPGRRPRTGGFDLVVVPGVAFDRGGRRLGQGLGYYDRFLRRLPEDVPRVGLATSDQVVSEVPVDEWDIAVHALATEEGVLRFPPGTGSLKK
ncbi:MAG: 5-formyltetrahydrofolate cyclo-ligase [Deltaproteobacteria bacterium]|nr:5-formyltetrahydrofolate cyclo-ligase [Deltaproteobacteria bacterium]